MSDAELNMNVTNWQQMGKTFSLLATGRANGVLDGRGRGRAPCPPAPLRRANTARARRVATC